MSKNLNEFKNSKLTLNEIDAIGEIQNISMGAASTSLSLILNKRVDITTPSVKVEKSKDFVYSDFEPAIGIEISYIEGLYGTNYMIMKEVDIHAMVNLLLEEDTEYVSGEPLSEMQLSALNEIMNQMMGASSTALAEFLGKSIGISIPNRFNPDIIKEKASNNFEDEYIVTISFDLHVEDLIDSKFITIFTIPFTKEIVDNAINMGDDDVPATPMAAPYKVMETSPQEAQPKKEESYMNNDLSSSYSKKIANEKVKTEKVNVQAVSFQSFDNEASSLHDDNAVDLGLVMDVELEVTVVIGRTKKPVKDVLDIRAGSVLELDKQASDPVDIIVNGQLMARGDVVVIEDNFGVRITEIVSKRNRLKY